MLSVTRLLVIVTLAAVLGGCATSATTTPTTTTPATVRSPQTLEYHLFTTTVDFNETAVGIPHDAFMPTAMFANVGDTLHIRYYNVEATDESGDGEHHTFTMGGPFNVNYDVAAGQSTNITLHADTPGVFAYRCALHQPTMTGYLVVLS